MASSGQIVLVKIPPYLKEYFIHCFGKEPIKARANTKLFIILAPYLERIPYNWRPPVSSADGLLIELPNNHIIRIQTYCYINPLNYGEIKKKLYNLIIMYLNITIKFRRLLMVS
jgi:hypothetical protein